MVVVLSVQRRGRTLYELVETKGLRQKFHVRVRDANGKILLSSEKYRHLADAQHLISRLTHPSSEALGEEE